MVLIAAVMYVSYRLRFWDQRLEIFLPMFTASLPLILVCKLLALYLSGVYNRMWGFFGIADLFALVRGVLFGSAASVLVAAYLDRFEHFSRGVFIIDGVLLAVALIAVRIAFKTLREASPVDAGRGARGRTTPSKEACQHRGELLRREAAQGLRGHESLRRERGGECDYHLVARRLANAHEIVPSHGGEDHVRHAEVCPARPGLRRNISRLPDRND